MNPKTTRDRKMILTVSQGLLLLVILSTLFSTAINLFFSSLMEDGLNVGAGTEIPAEQVSVPETAAPETGAEASPEASAEEIGKMEEMFGQASLKPLAAVMWAAFSLLFLIMALIRRHEWKYSLIQYGTGAALFAGCAAAFLFSGDHDLPYSLTAVLHGLGLAVNHAFSAVKNRRLRNVIPRVLGILLLGVGLTFSGRMMLLYVLCLTIPRIFVYIARISFSQVRMDILLRIIRKTFAAEILFGMLLLITAFSIILPNVEPGLSSFGDALWYCFMIVTTIGFGDLTAVTFPGRIISVILGIYGLIVVALLTSIIVNFYSETKGSEDKEKEPGGQGTAG